MMYQIRLDAIPTRQELLALYAAVGWVAYTKEPERLERAVQRSLAVYTGWDGDTLVALARAVGDGETILYVQDLLVHPQHQRQGVGRLLLERLWTDYSHVRQKVLIADCGSATDSFYRACGMKPGGEFGIAAYCKFN